MTHAPTRRRTRTAAPLVPGQLPVPVIAAIAAGTLAIAGIGFAGSYAAVRELAARKGFGDFSYLLPLGIDAGICVLLALDLLLTWLRIPFPLLRQAAWLLTATTIAFNGAAAWPNPLGVGMHAVVPTLFVVTVEAARHAIGRIADITADQHMEKVRLTRWLLSPLPTFLLWRRMKLWELRSYGQAIKLEQERLVYQARLRFHFGRAWRRKAPVESLMPLRLARYDVPLTQTAVTSQTTADARKQSILGRPGQHAEPTQGHRLRNHSDQSPARQPSDTTATRSTKQAAVPSSRPKAPPPPNTADRSAAAPASHSTASVLLVEPRDQHSTNSPKPPPRVTLKPTAAARAGTQTMGRRSTRASYSAERQRIRPAAPPQRRQAVRPFLAKDSARQQLSR
ncbi:DUF2637 domain-containing protein [Streptomyces echinatus]|uniref:DUF2637 domain-containing protein n=1 Tax=Streptomyces echinatus TaxID=67293 RepID=UPI003827E463